MKSFCSNALKPNHSIQNPPRSFLSSTNRCLLQRPNWVSFANNPRCAFPRSDCVYRATSEPLTGVERVRDDDDAVAVADVGSETGGLRRKKLAAFVSGGGSNFRAIHEACLAGLVHGDVAVLVTNKGGCGGAAYARESGIPVIVFPRTKDEPDGLFASDLVAALRDYEIDFILLAGYLKLIPTELIRAYPRHILNIHPSLLPAFGGKGYYGMKVHNAIIASGARFSGPTIHFVDEHYDTGRILAQRVVPVLATDTAEDLAARVLTEEHRVYVEVTNALCEERIVWREDGVPLIQSKGNPGQYE
ncbi:hypothetical protein MLD38_021060 [Melastoma candidum]|uniref:Uncharacterized protein n=1 Tax=Melastoma candidum TaxID=119954 RepID=A0ACB9QF67_9MYRT|nr:hypothetical protein MLD38_021060 [Melastoma candidum]